jgi:hypothetical protein
VIELSNLTAGMQRTGFLMSGRSIATNGASPRNPGRSGQSRLLLEFANFLSGWLSMIIHSNNTRMSSLLAIMA